MVMMLIIADDLTGALDTGVQFAGIKAIVIPYRELQYQDISDFEAEVLVVHTNTRHCTPQEAFSIVRHVTELAMENGIRIVYKKTDSALRGNVGSELDGVLAGSGFERLYFAPAFPQIGRTTVNGVQYVDGAPLKESMFRYDLIEPASESFLPDIISRQSRQPIHLIAQLDSLNKADEASGIQVFDAAEEDRMTQIARWILERDAPVAIAGCAGLAGKLAEAMCPGKKGESLPLPFQSDGVLVVSGSVNPLNLKQLAYARENGFDTYPVFHLRGFREENFEPCDDQIQELLQRFENSRKMVIMTADNLRQDGDDSGCWEMDSREVADHMGRVVAALYKKGLDGLVVISGGDTLDSVITGMQVRWLEPLTEVEAGVVLTRICIENENRFIVTKSGALGGEEVFSRIYERYCQHC